VRAGDEAGHVGDGEALSARGHDPEVGHQGGERVVGDLGRAADSTDTSEDLPADGKPTRPTSASGLELQDDLGGTPPARRAARSRGPCASARRAPCCPARRGPPRAMTCSVPRPPRSASTSPSASLTTVPSGTARMRSAPSAPLRSSPAPACRCRPAGAGGGGSPAASCCGSTRSTTEPPLPAVAAVRPTERLELLPPTDATPCPPSPAATCRTPGRRSSWPWGASCSRGWFGGGRAVPIGECEGAGRSGPPLALRSVVEATWPRQPRC
jgi:hypothetical protein